MENNPDASQPVKEITLTKDSSIEERRVVYDRLRAMRGKINWSLDGDWTQPDEPSAMPVASA